MSTTVQYKGNTLTTVSNATKTLKTAGKYMEGDVILTDVSGGSGAISVVDTTDTHGGTIRTITAVDISDTTAQASDVASGKYFYTADGTKTAGTSTGGGGGALKIGVIRPDAELVQRWSADELIVNDLGLTIPAYRTSTHIFSAGKTLASDISIDNGYKYLALARALTIPVYSTNTKTAGRQDYHLTVNSFEMEDIHAGDAKSIDGTAFINTSIPATASGTTTQIYFWNSATVLTVSTGSYGANQQLTSCFTHSVASNLTIKSPAYQIRGNTTYLTSSNWELLTDIRYQWVIELYRVPKNSTNVQGWNITSQTYSIFNNIVSNNGTLT